MQDELHILRQAEEFLVQLLADPVRDHARLSVIGIGDRVLLGTVAQQHHFRPVTVDAAAFRQSLLGDIEHLVQIVRAGQHTAQAAINTAALSDHDLADTALMTGTVTHAMAIGGQRSDLGPHAEILVEAVLLPDRRSNVAHPV
jgi:hypothetical protein